MHVVYNGGLEQAGAYCWLLLHWVGEGVAICEAKVFKIDDSTLLSYTLIASELTRPPAFTRLSWNEIKTYPRRSSLVWR